MVARESTPKSCEHCGSDFFPCVKRPGRFCSSACHYAFQRAGATERFWRHIHKTETCWLWTGAVASTGYGKASVSRRYRDSSAHRVAWVLTNGPITDGLWVLHRCDTPLCVNPAHLFLGTHDDNMADMATKQRAVHGARQHHAKLTDDAVRQIRAARRDGADPQTLAAQFGVDVSTINRIARRGAWTHVA